MKLHFKKRTIIDDIDDKINNSAGLEGISLNTAEWDTFCKEMRSQQLMPQAESPISWIYREIKISLELDPELERRDT